jgi:hypothetical protein
MVDLLVITSSDQLLFILKIFFDFYKTSYLTEEVTVVSFPFQYAFPGLKNWPFARLLVIEL